MAVQYLTPRDSRGKRWLRIVLIASQCGWIILPPMCLMTSLKYLPETCLHRTSKVDLDNSPVSHIFFRCSDYWRAPGWNWRSFLLTLNFWHRNGWSEWRRFDFSLDISVTILLSTWKPSMFFHIFCWRWRKMMKNIGSIHSRSIILKNDFKRFFPFILVLLFSKLI